jgi:hypothetical protein
MLSKHLWIGLRPTVALHDDDRRLLSTLRPAGVVVLVDSRNRGFSGRVSWRWPPRIRGFLGRVAA